MPQTTRHGDTRRHVLYPGLATNIRMYAAATRSDPSDPEVIRGACGIEVDRLAKKHAAAHNVGYAEALRSVLSDPNNAELKHAYAVGAVEESWRASWR